MDTADRVRALVAPLVANLDAELYDVEYNGGLLRVTIDRPGGVDIDVIASLTRDLSHLLDESDPIAGHYTLEVSSPGLERHLRRPEHFAWAVGTTVALKLRAGVEGDRRVRGTLVAAEDGHVTVEPSGPAGSTGDAPRTIALVDIDRARTVFEWGPAPKPGRAPASTSPSAKNKKKAGKS
ncbi:MAG: ribosome maturation factor RimP [Acidimicrobiales bacterium]